MINFFFYQSLGKGIVGIQGPFYAGTGTFHRRKVIYGLWPDEIENQGKCINSVNGIYSNFNSL